MGTRNPLRVFAALNIRPSPLRWARVFLFFQFIQCPFSLAITKEEKLLKTPWTQDGRNYKKLVNDGVLRTFKCRLCGKVLPPCTTSVSDTRINHALKYTHLIPTRALKNASDDSIVSQSYYLGVPKGRLAESDPLSTDLNLCSQLVCSSNCTGLAKINQNAVAAAKAVYDSQAESSKNVYVNIDTIWHGFLPPTGAALIMAANSYEVCAEDFTGFVKKTLNKHGYMRLEWPPGEIYVHCSNSDGVTRYIDFCKQSVYPDITFAEGYLANA